MTSADIALLVTAIGGSLAAILTAVAALRNANANSKRVDDILKANQNLQTEMAQKTEHNEFQDALILDQQVKLQKWATWGDRVGRNMNEMQLMIGWRQQHGDPDDTLPLPGRKD